MKAVILYETAQDIKMERIMEVYPLHQSLVDEFIEKGKVIGIGPFGNPGEGSMGIFTDIESAEDFVKNDPFVIEGIVSKYTLREWNDTIH